MTLAANGVGEVDPLDRVGPVVPFFLGLEVNIFFAAFLSLFLRISSLCLQAAQSFLTLASMPPSSGWPAVNAMARLKSSTAVPNCSECSKSRRKFKIRIFGN